MAIVHLTENEWLTFGLRFVGFDQYRQQTCNATKVQRFKSCYAISPKSCIKIFTDLQTSDTGEERIDGAKPNAKYFLLTLYWLKSNVTESVLAGVFRISERTIRTHVWRFISSIHSLRSRKVSGCLYNNKPEKNYDSHI